MADKECNYKNNDHCTIDTNYCAPNNTGQHCFIRKYADERQENKVLQTRIVKLETALKLIKQGIKDRGDCKYWDDEDYAYKCKECDIPVNCPYNIASKALED